MRRAVLVGVITVFLVLLLITKVIDNKYNDQKASGRPEPVETSEGDPPDLVQSKRDANSVAARFVSVFYSRPNRLLALDLDERMEQYVAWLEPYVTEDFLKLYTYPLSTSHDEELARIGGNVRAAISHFGPGHVHGSSMDKEVDIRFTTRWPDLKTQHSEISILIYMIRQDGQWRVEGYEDLSTQ